MFLARLLGALALSLPLYAVAQPAATVVQARPEGTLVILTGQAEIEVANDEAVASLYAELQDADLARAQSLVNQRMADGIAQLKRLDPKAQIETAGYSSYAIYGRDPARKVVAWRVRQNVQMRTGDFVALPRAIAGAQQQLALAGIDFRLSRAARERIEGELIQRAIANLNARVAAAAQALDVPKSRLRIEELDFGGSRGGEPPPIVAMARAGAVASPEGVAEPQFEAGRSVQQVTVTGRIRFVPG